MWAVYPACTNTNVSHTDLKDDPFTKLVEYPRDWSACSVESFLAFASTDGYEHSYTALEGPAPAWGRRLGGASASGVGTKRRLAEARR